MQLRHLLPALPVLFLIACGNPEPEAQAPKADTADTTAKAVVPPKPVERIDPNDTVFEWLRSIPLPSQVWDFGVLPNGNIVVGRNSKDSAICVLSPEGKVLRAFGTIGRGDSAFRDHPTKIALGPDGSVHCIDGVENRVLSFDSTGRFLHLARPANMPGGIAVNSKGEMLVTLVTGWIVEIYDAGGKLLSSSKSIKNDGHGVIWGYMADIAVDSADRMYVTNWREMSPTGGGAVVHVCEPDGKYIRTHDKLKTDHNSIVGTADPVGRFFCEDITHIKVYNTEGKLIARFGKEGKGDGEFKRESVEAIEVTKTGYVYVAAGDHILVFR